LFFPASEHELKLLGVLVVGEVMHFIPVITSERCKYFWYQAALPVKRIWISPCFPFSRSTAMTLYVVTDLSSWE
jgi:hypothetical protein